MKIFKYLAYVGLASAAAYVAYIITDTSNDTYSKRGRLLEGNPFKAGTPNADRNRRHDKRSERHSGNRAQMMYSNLGMTEEQKREYEHDYHAVTGSWQRDNPNYEMDDQQKLDHQSATLKAVLNEVQYAMYRDAIDHRYS